MAVEHDGRLLGGHSVQVAVGGPQEIRRGVDEDVVLTLRLAGGSRCTTNFALAPWVAIEIEIHAQLGVAVKGHQVKYQEYSRRAFVPALRCRPLKPSEWSLQCWTARHD